MDEKAISQTKTNILSLIEKGVNRKFFREDRLEGFFDLCFSLGSENAAELMKDKTFNNFVYQDLKIILQIVNGTDNLEKFAKFMVFFKVDEDPELLDVLCDNIASKMSHFTTDEILNILVNLKHTLSPEALQIYLLANNEFCSRLNDNFSAENRDLYL